MIFLSDRKILQISGIDAKNFLQGLITNDINLLDSKTLIYTANLNANGKFFADFFIFKKKENYYLDCHINCIEDIAKKFNFFKLRSNVEIKIRDDFKIFFSNEVGEDDPRIDGFGYRLYDEKNQIFYSDKPLLIKYHEKRIYQKLPEGYYDLTDDKSYIAEYDFDSINAVSYQKGCYVGQETTARNHYRGQIRKKIFLFEVINVNQELREIIEKNNNFNSLQIQDERLILCNLKNQAIFNKKSFEDPDIEPKELGIVLSTIYYHKTNVLKGLALIKIEDFVDSIANDQYFSNLFLYDNNINIS